MAQSTPPLAWMKAPNSLAITGSQSGEGSLSLPHAVILRREGSLQCFERTSTDGYAIMTIQRGFEEEPMHFEAREEILYRSCIPAILRKIFTREPMHIALIDMDLEWDHETLLQEWLDFQRATRSAAQNLRVTLRTFIAEEAYEPVPYSETTWQGLQTEFRDRGQLSEVPMTTVLANKDPSGVTFQTGKGGITFLIAAVDDIPADFDRIVWMLKHSGNRQYQGLDHRLVDLLRREECVTTLRAASHLYPLPALKNILSLYRKLRSVQGQAVFVPMVGFEATGLRATSYLHAFSDQSEIDIPWTEFERLRSIRYYPSRLRVSGKDRLLLSAQRCLSMADQGLQLFDLTEEIIYDLTGQLEFRLCFADVCRVYQALKRCIP